MKSGWILSILIGLASTVYAATPTVFPRSLEYYPQGIATSTGTVQGQDSRRLDVFDEDEKRVLTFTDQFPEKFNRGDYVRVYYWARTGVIIKVKRMTIYKYDPKDQNLGYISR